MQLMLFATLPLLCSTALSDGSGRQKGEALHTPINATGDDLREWRRVVTAARQQPESMTQTQQQQSTLLTTASSENTNDQSSSAKREKKSELQQQQQKGREEGGTFECYRPTDAEKGCPAMDWYDVVDGPPIPAGETRLVPVISPFWRLNGCSVTVATHQSSWWMNRRRHGDRLSWRLMTSSQRYGGDDRSKKNHTPWSLPPVRAWFKLSIDYLKRTVFGIQVEDKTPPRDDRWFITKLWDGWMEQRRREREKRAMFLEQRRRTATLVRSGDPLWHTYRRSYQTQSDVSIPTPALDYDVELTHFQQVAPVSCGTTCQTPLATSSTTAVNTWLEEEEEEEEQKAYLRRRRKHNGQGLVAPLSSSSSASPYTSFFGATLAITCQNRFSSCRKVRYRVECELSVLPPNLGEWSGDFFGLFVFTLMLLLLIVAFVVSYLRQYYYVHHQLPFDYETLSFSFPLVHAGKEENNVNID